GGGRWEHRAPGPATLKGMDAPVHAWAVLEESTIDSRFETLRHEQVPLVGRTEQMELLLRRWEQAKTGAGRVILLSGEPAMGKSRLIAPMEQKIADARRALRFLCSRHYQDTPLHPVIQQLERAAGFQRGDSAAVKREKLRRALVPDALSGQEIDLLGDLLSIVKREKLQRVLVPDALSEQEIDLLGDLLSIPAAAGDERETLSPQRRKERTFAVLLKHFRILARQSPVLVVFEDIHWADPTTRELLDLMIESADRLAVLVVLTTRPELQPAWAVRPHVAVQMLNAMNRREAAILIQELAGDRELPTEVVDRIIARSDGIPLFIEELTKTVLERGVPHQDEKRVVLLVPMSADSVPATLHASLMARLDRLAVGKDIALTGSVIGRDFSFETMHAGTNLEARWLEQALGELVQAGLINARGQPPDAVYTFKHALVQDAAYASLLRDRRRAIHRRVAEMLETDAVGGASELQLVAWHFAEAGLPDRSIEYYEKAANRATGRFALAEMASHLRNGLAQVGRLPDSPGRQKRELDLQVALGRALIDHQGSGAEEVRAAFERARELCL